MRKPTGGRDERVSHAADLARDVAPDLDVVLFTHYPDLDTLDTLRPGETDIEGVQAETRAAAAELLDAGVELLVQRGDRAAFRRWMSDRADTPENRRAWIDRKRLLRGQAAAELLGIQVSAAAPSRTFGKAPGPEADLLLEAYRDEEGDEFDLLVQALMDAGRIDVLDLAVRKLGQQGGDEAGDELDWVLLVAAEGAAVGPSGWAELVVLPVAMPAGEAPDGEALAAGLLASGALPDTDEVRFLPGWRSPDALAELSFAAVRRVLVDMVDGRAPRDLPPGDTDQLVRHGFGVLLGLRTDWAIPIWEEILAAGGLPEPPDDAEPTPDEADQAARFERWQASVFGESGCAPLSLVAFSQTANTIADFLTEAGEQTAGLEEIRAFVAEARRQTGGGDIVCLLETVGEDLKLTLYTADGRTLESLTMAANRLPAGLEQMPRVIGALVRVVQQAP